MLGIEAVVNPALPDSSHALPGEAARVTREGMSYLHIPVEWTAPDLASLRVFFGVLKVYERRRVWVHCALNLRVSAFALLYRRLCLGKNEADACHPLASVWTAETVWQAFTDEALGLAGDPAYNWPAYKRVA